MGGCNIFTRLKTLLFELALPLFDFISDILNGRRLIKDCHIIFGSLTIGIVFAPMAVFLPFLTIVYRKHGHFSGWKKFLLPVVYPVAVILATPSYVGYICFVAIRKIIDIEYQPDDDVGWNGDPLVSKSVGSEGQLTDLLKFSEITLESETQLILGECRSLIR